MTTVILLAIKTLDPPLGREARANLGSVDLFGPNTRVVIPHNEFLVNPSTFQDAGGKL